VTRGFAAGHRVTRGFAAAFGGLGALPWWE
jgi:hypothetical protein